MAVRRAVVPGIAAAVAALLLSACGVSPLLPPTVAVTSPYHGASTLDPLSQTGGQAAKIRVCSVGGGPLAVDVHIAAPIINTFLAVRAMSTDLEVTHDLADATLFDRLVEDELTADTHFESTRPMRAGECADVFLGSGSGWGDPGLPFTFTITW